MAPAIIAAIITSAVAATTTGLEIANQPSAPKPVSTAPVPLTEGQNQAQKTAVGQALPNLQSLTGGSLSPEYAAQIGAVQSGVGNDPQATGNIQAAINQFFGLNAPGNTGLTPNASGSSGGGGITDLLKNAGTSGASSPGGSSNIGNWIQQATSGGNDFRGLAG